MENVLPKRRRFSMRFGVVAIAMATPLVVIAANESWASTGHVSGVGLAASTVPGSAQLGTPQLYPTGALPTMAAADDTLSVELGVQFKAKVAGSVTGVRFLKSVASTGVHTGSLWDSTGKRLATATFSGETNSGWQQVLFSTAIALTPGKVYVVSFHTKNGSYYDQQGQFYGGKTLSSASITATAGVFHYGASAYPSQTWNDSNYFADVVFRPATTSSASATSTSSGTSTPTETPSTPAPSTPAPSSPVASPTKAPSSSAAPSTQPASPTPTPTKPASPPPVTTTPTPTASATGKTGCAASPHTCGFPDATNTGYSGTLSASSVSTISTAGTTIANATLGCLNINASNVTIKNSLIVGSTPDSFCINIANGVSNTLIEDTTIHGTNSTNNSIEYGIRDYGNNTEVLRANMYWCTECIAGSSTNVQDTYIHDLGTISGAHYEDFYIGEANGLTINHSTIFNQQEQTAAIYMSPDFGNITHVTITNNLLAGGGYTIYGGADQPSKPSSNVVVTGNLFSTMLFPAGGQWGTLDYWSSANNTWSGNSWTDGPNAGKTI